MLEVYTDAATKGDPGPSFSGIYIKSKSEKYSYSSYLGELSNHEAEFASACQALRVCKERFPKEIISLRTDSKIVVETFERNRTKNHIFFSYLETLDQLAENFPFVFMKWIPEKQNIHADQLSKESLRKYLYDNKNDT
ncbi:RNase H family protein [Salimicrobium flavidum]|uniref:RNase HI n=1 Tax=Salimicrobium flavidum TaxID=570947 RepID=A0A1N7IJJ7_9BACI|nr:RNase H family protein [Salimicrobium flavidum]SIS37238.1 RNase HI [Salimicrobium flavidum]